MIKGIIIGFVLAFAVIAGGVYYYFSSGMAAGYVRTQPFVSPKIELSNQRTERVDVRVLPVIFRIQKSVNVNLFPDQLVDVYISSGD